MPDKDSVSGVQIPADLSALSDDELLKLESDSVTEFDSLYEAENLDAESLRRVGQLADGIESVRALQIERKNSADAALAELADIRSRIHPGGQGETEDESSESEITPEPVAVAASASRVDVRNVLKPANANLNVRLSQAASHVPGSAQPKLRDKFDASVLVASADIPGFTTGGRLDNMQDLVSAFQTRARSLPVTRQGDMAPHYSVAQLQRHFRYMLDSASSPDAVYEVMKEAANPAALVAAGGWCSPSEIRYDFYDIAEIAGLLDLPTAGIRRGGLRWPTSPSFNDVSSVTCTWHWNETQDIAAVTGTSQSGTKTCCRVPCAEFNEERLECEGICVTAGNLATDAWPESIANYLRLINVAHARRVNAWMINALVSRSIAVSVCPTGVGLTVPVLDAVEMQAIDYRTRYGMAGNSILEVVLPEWILGGIRADLAKRVFASPNYAFAVDNAMIGDWFTTRNVRVQFVQDWQVRTVGFPGHATNEMTTWPTTVQFLIYAAGTFLRGNGLNLDLGVVRDSVLNATNDYTAAWSEECFLVAEIGHESRIVTVPICPNGTVGAATTFACPNC